MKLLGRTQPLSRYPIETCLETIRRLGFDGAEICLENEDLRPETLDEATAGRVRATVERLGMSPWSVSYHQNYLYDDAKLELTLKAIALTPAFGTDVFVFSGTRKRTGDQAEWSRAVQRTARMAEVAERHGVTLALETEPNFVVGTTAELHRLIEDVGSDRLAANLDLGHAFLCDPDPLEAIRSLAGRIAHGHVENMPAGEHRHLPPQSPEGAMDLGAYLATLREVGFTGGLALDLYKEDYEQIAPESIAFLRQLLDRAEG